MTTPDSNSGSIASTGGGLKAGRLDGLLGGKERTRMRGHTPLDPATLVLSVLVPVYNERNTIELILEQVRTAVDVKTEILVVDDYSTDGTREILTRLQAEGRIDRLI
ncbi:MAG TPA: glycosyltransferase, partial [Gemmatimonadaceae bacterium]